MGGRAPAGPLVWVPYPQGLEKGVVVGTVKGGAAPGTHRTTWQDNCALPSRRQPRRSGKRCRGGGEATEQASPHTGRRGGQPHPNPQTDRGRREARHRVRTCGAASAAAATGSAEDHAQDTQGLWESPSSRERQGTPGAPLGVLGGHPCDNGVAARERLFCLVCVCVCVLTSVGRVFNSENSNVKKSSKNLFEAGLLVFERFLQRLKSVKNTHTPRPKNPRASLKNHKKLPRQ